MHNKSAVTFLFVFLAIIPAYAALPQQPNSVSLDPNSLQKLIDDANKGDPNVQVKLGITSRAMGSGRIIIRRLIRYTTAAQQGNACAQCHLGKCFRQRSL
jgi:hypothetical protein